MNHLLYVTSRSPVRGDGPRPGDQIEHDDKENRVNIRAVITAGLAALAAACALLTGTVSPAGARAPAAGGMVCMFQAPTGAHLIGLNAGHVAWAYRWANAAGGRWDFGATEHGGVVWNRNGTWDEMLGVFRSRTRPDGDPGPYYTRYRCAHTGGADQAAARRKRAELDHLPYSLLNDNCLTRSIEIFKAYDSSGGLNILSTGKADNWQLATPNDYFAEDLTGFGPARSL
jgi:hypothetical protein